MYSISIALLLTCLACVGHGRRVQILPVRLPDIPLAEHQEHAESAEEQAESAEDLLRLFFLPQPKAAFVPSGIPALFSPRLVLSDVSDVQNRRGSAIPAARMSEDSDENVAPLDSTASGGVEPLDALQRWVLKQTLNTLLQREEAIQTVQELGQDTDWINRQRPIFEKVFNRGEALLRDEQRSIVDFVGKDGADRILKALERIDGDEKAARTFLKTPAIEGIVGSLLYEGIFEFIRTVDLLGNIVNQLPIIGPIRKQILDLFKKSIDQTLGRQVKSFLGTYSRAATEQLVSLVLSQENAAKFAEARRRLGDEVLKRPVSSFVPEKSTVERLRDGSWELLQDQLVLLGNGKIINEVYDRFGDQSLEALGVEELTQEAQGPLRETANRVLWRFLDSEEGKLFIEGAQQK